MRPWARYGITTIVGLGLGIGGAAIAVKTRALGADDRIGPWTTGTDFGSAEASALTRAVVALRGLLALPASEARYFNAAVDDAGRPLDGRCTYRVTGGAMPARWWSLTLYGADDFLVPNDANIFSVASPAIADPSAWTITVSPTRAQGHWLPTGKAQSFDLTLRNYLPADGGKGNPPRAALPRIARMGCAS